MDPRRHRASRGGVPGRRPVGGGRAGHAGHAASPLSRPRQPARPPAVHAVRVSHHRPRLRRQRPAARRARPRVPPDRAGTTDIPPIVRDAILAAEDKHFFSHNGVDYSSIPRVIGEGQGGRLAVARWPREAATTTRAAGRSSRKAARRSPSSSCAACSSSVRRREENSYQLRSVGRRCLVCCLSVIGARNVNMVLRKREEIRLSLWIEEQMREQFGSKRRAKEEILARYASFVYMGNGQYGFARAAEYYFGRPLSSFTADDADKAALLAGIAKSPRDYAPTAKRRRDPSCAAETRSWRSWPQSGFISRDQMTAARQRPLPAGRAARAAAVPAVRGRRARARRASKPSTPTSASTISCRDASRCTRRLMPACSASRATRLSTASQRYEQRHPAPAGWSRARSSS